MSANPILVEVTRGGRVESVHRGAVCVSDADGRVLHHWGDVEALVCPRSTLKPFQAVPLIESGAAEAFHVTEEELALACASHSAETVHVRMVAAWLERIGKSVEDLECGGHAPVAADAHAELILKGMPFTAMHNNCSGKHTGFLTLALHMGVATRGYTNPDHPVQRAALGAVGEMTGFDVAGATIVRDGCSAPNLYLPLRALAAGWARLGAATGSHAAAAKRIGAAMRAHPELVAGSTRPSIALYKAMAGSGFAKVGAEGTYAAALPERGLGIAVKIDDGAGRAGIIALAAVLRHIGVLADTPEAASLLETPMTAWAGARTGEVRKARSWLP